MTLLRYFLLFGLVATATAQEPDLDSFMNFETDSVARVEISVEPKLWDRLCAQNRPFSQIFSQNKKDGTMAKPFSYFPADIKINGHEIKNVGIRKKGFIGSLDGFRPSLKVKLDFQDEDQEIDGINVLTLNNCKQDAPLINAYLTYSLYNRLGSPAPRASFASVFVNGNHLGVYCHVESMKKPMAKRAFGNDKGTLYEGTVVDFYPGWENSFERKFGKKDRGMDAIKKLTEVLNGDLNEEEFVKHISDVVDIDAFLKYWALESLIGFWDGYSGNTNNFFFYVSKEDNKMRFLPWGADSVFSEREMRFGRNGPSYKAVKTKGILAGKLYEVESIRSKYFDTLLAILDNGWDEKAMVKDISRLEEMLEPHIHSSQGRFNDAILSTKEFVENRKFNVLEETINGLPEISFEPRPPMYSPSIGNLKGSFEAPVFGEAPEIAEGNGKQNISISYRDKQFKAIGYGVFIGPQNFEGGRGFGRGFGRNGRVQEMVSLRTELYLDHEPDQLTLSVGIPKDYLNPPYGTPIVTDASLEEGNEFSTSQNRFSASAVITIDRVEGEGENRKVFGTLDVQFSERGRGFFGR